MVEKPVIKTEIHHLENTFPVLVEVNSIVKEYVDRIIDVPIVHQEIVEVKIL